MRQAKRDKTEGPRDAQVLCEQHLGRRDHQHREGCAGGRRTTAAERRREDGDFHEQSKGHDKVT